MTWARAAWHLFRKSWQAWNDGYAASMGAALAYYTTFSLAPLLSIVIAVAGGATSVFAELQSALDRISAQVFLLGAEFTWVFAHSHGSRAGQEPAVADPRATTPSAA